MSIESNNKENGNVLISPEIFRALLEKDEIILRQTEMLLDDMKIIDRLQETIRELTTLQFNNEKTTIGCRYGVVGNTRVEILIN
ncbi:MAG: hypothetical protein P4L28_05420 [Paludibacteraceae bacterium]|nr:hypothetical protein [Paludibacteraceae bacterium]